MKLLSAQSRRAIISVIDEPIFHGMRYLSQILRDDELAKGDLGCVSLSYCPEVAAMAASASPKAWDDGRGAILVMDASILWDDFKLEEFEHSAWTGATHEDRYVACDISILSRYTFGYVWLDELVPGLGLAPPLRVGPFRPVPLGLAARARLVAATKLELLRNAGASPAEYALYSEGLCEFAPKPISRLEVRQVGSEGRLALHRAPT